MRPSSINLPALGLGILALVMGIGAFIAHLPVIVGAALLSVGCLALIAAVLLRRPAAGVSASPPMLPPVALARPPVVLPPPAPDVALVTPTPAARVSPAPPAAPLVPEIPVVLPALGPLFVGREQELVELDAGLRRARGATAIAVIGPAGAGKRSLIMQAIDSHRSAGTFPDGYSWHACSDLHGDLGVRRLLLEILDRFGGPSVAMTSTLRMGEAAVADLVRGKRILFWLDDVQDDFPIARVLTTLTARDGRGTGPALLLSSQSDWAMPEISELACDVPQMDEAFDLFRDWLELCGRELDFEEYTAAKAICVNLSRLPLALRLAAGYAAQSGAKLAKLAADLGSAVYPPGDVTRTAEKTIAFVEQSLFPMPRRAFAALAVFESPVIDLAAASAVAAVVSGDTVAATQTDLEALVVLGLLEPAGDDARPQLRLQPQVHRYITARLQELGPEVEARARAALATVLRAKRVTADVEDEYAWNPATTPARR